MKKIPFFSLLAIMVIGLLFASLLFVSGSAQDRNIDDSFSKLVSPKFIKSPGETKQPDNEPVADNPDQLISLKLYSLETAYDLFRTEGIFYRDQYTSLNCAKWAACYYARQLPVPVLRSNEKNNLEATTDYLRKVFYSRPSKIEEINREVISGLTATDPYGRLIAGHEFQAVVSKEMGSYEGDGVELDYCYGKVVVFLVFLNTPGAAAGIQSGDEVLKINDVSFENTTSNEDFEARLQQLTDSFKEGKEITYWLVHNDEKIIRQTKAIKITDKNKLVTYRLEDKIGIIEIKEFAAGSGLQFLEAMNKIKSAGAKALIVNLRNNPGGFVSETLIIVKALTGKGFKNRRKDNGEEVRIISDQLVRGPQFSGPIAVLINRGSASAAETTAACLQEYGATVFGKTSYGKNFGQRIYLLPDRNYFLASDHWIETMSGLSWISGIQPDVVTGDQEVWQKAKNFLEEKIKNQPTSLENKQKIEYNVSGPRWNKNKF